MRKREEGECLRVYVRMCLCLHRGKEKKKAGRREAKRARQASL